MLEPYVGKSTRTVLRRERGSNPSDLAGKKWRSYQSFTYCYSRVTESLGMSGFEQAYSLFGVRGVRRTIFDLYCGSSFGHSGFVFRRNSSCFKLFWEELEEACRMKEESRFCYVGKMRK